MTQEEFGQVMAIVATQRSLGLVWFFCCKRLLSSPYKVLDAFLQKHKHKYTHTHTRTRAHAHIHKHTHTHTWDARTQNAQAGRHKIQTQRKPNSRLNKRGHWRTPLPDSLSLLQPISSPFFLRCPVKQSSANEPLFTRTRHHYASLNSILHRRTGGGGGYYSQPCSPLSPDRSYLHVLILYIGYAQLSHRVYIGMLCLMRF